MPTFDPRRRLSARFDQAFAYASLLHASQTRKGSRTPYIAHLMGVAALVLEDGGSEDEAIAGLLHAAFPAFFDLALTVGAFFPDARCGRVHFRLPRAFA